MPKAKLSPPLIENIKTKVADSISGYIYGPITRKTIKEIETSVINCLKETHPKEEFIVKAVKTKDIAPLYTAKEDGIFCRVSFPILRPVEKIHIDIS